MGKIKQLIAKKSNISERQVESVISLLNDGATVPFISRYRKEATGSLDEVQIAEIKTLLAKYRELEKRKSTILKAIKEQELLSDELERKISDCYEPNVLEDYYLPYKKKKKTKAGLAKEKGLEPLAKIIIAQQEDDPKRVAKRFVNNKVKDLDEAIQGALDIIAEWINERAYARKRLRNLFQKTAIITSKLVKTKEEEGQKFKDYFDYTEPINKIKSHRILALFRGEKEGILKLKIEPLEQEAIEIMEDIFVEGWNESSMLVKKAVKESYKRLLKPSIENEIRKELKEMADDKAIDVFSDNLKQLLLAAPIGEKRILAIDPGFRTGCKVVCLSQNGDLMHNETIYPHAPQKEIVKAKKKVNSLVQQYKIEVIAIGNGTASRETEFFIKGIRYDRELQVFVVSEDGASIYSASKVAREEFPQYDVTVRGAISIGRRLMDPLAELVKIDPKSIGVGQYQHDVDQKKLKENLDDVVINSVNKVGVNLNVASKYLLTYVSGLGETLAQNIVDYRNEIGNFNSRKQLKEVKRMGEKAYEQAAGFLRISNGNNPLDNSAVHPESYHIVEKMATSLSVKIESIIGNEELVNRIDPNKFIDEKFGLISIKEILKELAKPTRDPRKKAKVFSFLDELRTIDDVKTGMIVPGIVTNVTNFGAFVDIGIKENGLIHISNMAQEYISNPADVLAVHQQIEAKVISVEPERKRIGLSLVFN